MQIPQVLFADFRSSHDPSLGLPIYMDQYFHLFHLDGFRIVGRGRLPLRRSSGVHFLGQKVVERAIAMGGTMPPTMTAASARNEKNEKPLSASKSTLTVCGG